MNENMERIEEGTQQPTQQIVPQPTNKELIVEPKKEDKMKKKKELLTWWGKNFNKNKLKKSNKVAVVYLRDNGNADLMELESKNGFFNINGKSYHENRDCTFTITKDRLPLIIVKEWDILPLGNKTWDDKPMREKFAELETHVLKGIRHAELVKVGGEKDTKSVSTKQAILWALVALVIGAVVVNYL